MPATATKRKKPAAKSAQKTAEVDALAEKIDTPQTPADPGKFHMIPLDRISESPTNPRKVFHGIEELADSIRTRGVIQPILVRPPSTRRRMPAMQPKPLVYKVEEANGDTFTLAYNPPNPGCVNWRGRLTHDRSGAPVFTVRRPSLEECKNAAEFEFAGCGVNVRSMVKVATAKEGVAA